MSWNLLIGMIILFVATLGVGHWVRRNKEKAVYDNFVKLFGVGVAGVNFIAAGMLMFATEIAYIDRVSHAILPFMVGVIMMTLIKLNNKQDG